MALARCHPRPQGRAVPAAVVIEKFGRAHRTRAREWTSGGKPRSHPPSLRRPKVRATTGPKDRRGRAGALSSMLSCWGAASRRMGILNALDRGFSREAAFDGFAKAAVPAFIVSEHAIGFEHIAMLAGRRQMLVFEHLVDVELQPVRAPNPAGRVQQPGCLPSTA